MIGKAQRFVPKLKTTTTTAKTPVINATEVEEEASTNTTTTTPPPAPEEQEEEEETTTTTAPPPPSEGTGLIFSLEILVMKFDEFRRSSRIINQNDRNLTIIIDHSIQR